MLLAADLLQILAACKPQLRQQCPSYHHKLCPIHHWQIFQHDLRDYLIHQQVEGYHVDLDDRQAKMRKFTRTMKQFHNNEVAIHVLWLGQPLIVRALSKSRQCGQAASPLIQCIELAAVLFKHSV